MKFVYVNAEALRRLDATIRIVADWAAHLADSKMPSGPDFLCSAYQSSSGGDNRCPVNQDIGKLGCLAVGDDVMRTARDDLSHAQYGKVVDYLRDLRKRCSLEVYPVTIDGYKSDPSCWQAKGWEKTFHARNCKAVDCCSDVKDPDPPKPTFFCPQKVIDAIKEAANGKWTDLIEDPFMREPKCSVCAVAGMKCKDCPLKWDGNVCASDSLYGKWLAVRSGNDYARTGEAARKMRDHLLDLASRCRLNDVDPDFKRRKKFLRVSFELLAQVLEHGTQAADILEPIKDPVIVDTYRSVEVPDTVIFIIQSPDFDVVSLGAKYPELDPTPTFTKRDDAGGLRRVIKRTLIDFDLTGKLGGYVDDKTTISYVREELKAALDEEAKR